MKKVIVATICVAAISAFSAVGASAQMTGPQGQQTMKNNDSMNSNGRMMHRSHHLMMKKKMRHGHMMKHNM